MFFKKDRKLALCDDIKFGNRAFKLYGTNIFSKCKSLSIERSRAAKNVKAQDMVDEKKEISLLKLKLFWSVITTLKTIEKGEG